MYKITNLSFQIIMRLFLILLMIHIAYGNIEFPTHKLNFGEKGILSIHTADINSDANTDIIYSSIESNSIIW